jgi:hypothetical protein
MDNECIDKILIIKCGCEDDEMVKMISWWELNYIGWDRAQL